MLKNLLKNKVKIGFIFLLVLLLAAVRAFEARLFYDPFLDYFKNEFSGLSLPKFDAFRLILSLLMRYFLNTIFSLAIIQLVFREIELVKFAALLYLIFFLVLITAFFIIIYFSGAHSNLILFYIRRFLIQPLFILLFIPAFLYQKQKR